MNLWNKVIGEMKRHDAILFVLDARCPLETRSEKLESIANKTKKPFWIIPNKVDLVPKEFADKTKEFFKENSKAVDVVHVSAKKYYGVNILRWSLRRILEKTVLKEKEKAYLIVVGYPNVGKSSIINMLARRSKAGVSPKPGFTRGKQWIRVSKKILISDTPGVVPIEKEEWKNILFPGENLESSALWLLSKIKNADGSNFHEVYGFDIKDVEESEALKLIGERFKFLKKGGEIDVNRAAKRLIDDWNRGKLSAWWL